MPPFLIQPPANRSGDVGDDIELTCVVGGDPVPDIYWSLPRGERRKGDALLHVLKVNALQRRSDICNPRNETARPRSHWKKWERGSADSFLDIFVSNFWYSVFAGWLFSWNSCFLSYQLPRSTQIRVYLITAKKWSSNKLQYMSYVILEASSH